MTVGSIASVGQENRPSASASAFGGSSGEIQDRFLKLLVAQLKNQDPLEPMDNAQVTSQMAQLSTVTGIQDLNDTMAGIANAFEASETLRATSLIGSSVTVPGDRLAVAESGSSFAAYELSGPADAAVFEVLDAAGNVIYSQDLGARPAGSHGIEWDGLDSKGGRVPEGVYRFNVTASSGDKPVASRTLEQRLVFGVENSGQGVILNIGGGERVSIKDVIEFGA